MIAAITAGCAAGIIDTVLALSTLNSVVCADVQATAAVCAKGFDKSYLGLFRKAFRIRAPFAGQRTTLKKDHCSNPGSIVNREALNVRNNRTLRGNGFHNLLSNQFWVTGGKGGAPAAPIYVPSGLNAVFAKTSKASTS
jgi:hypothetical protein